MEYGFVYIWRDRKHKRYYIGCHWGTETDDYICSSRWMKKSYKRRSHDFKRRVLIYIYTSKKDMFECERYWIEMIKESELKIRYYNVYNTHFNHWSSDQTKFEEVSKKISKRLKHYYSTEEGLETRRENSKRLKHYYSTEEGLETRRRVSQSLFGKCYLTEEGRIKLSKANKNKLVVIDNQGNKFHVDKNDPRYLNGELISMHVGRKNSIETKQKMSENNAMKNVENRKKIGDKNKGTIALWKDGKKKMAKPRTNKWNLLISEGFLPREELV